jgi:hypothetical protein
VAEYLANVITDNMIAMVDDEGYKRMILKNIADHRCDVVKALSLPEV